MFNPWGKKNPWMSLWLSGANRVANTARGTATAAAKRQSKSAFDQASRDIAAFWGLPAATAGAPRKRRRTPKR